MARKYVKRYTYKLPPITCLGDDVAANVAFFQLENTGSIEGRFRGHILAADQRLIFGRYFGKGLITIAQDGTVRHIVKRCFGTDWEVTHTVALVDLARR